MPLSPLRSVRVGCGERPSSLARAFPLPRVPLAFDGMVKEIVETKSMEEAVRSAYFLSEKGDTVLLSPACASFDLFKNYEDRGRQFKDAVRNL